MEGRYVPSLLAAIGQVIERHLIDIGFLKPGDPPLVYDPHALRAAASGAGSPADGEDDAVVAGMAQALRPGGRLALSAFNAYFAVKYHDDADFDAATGVSHERTEIRDEMFHTGLRFRLSEMAA